MKNIEFKEYDNMTKEELYSLVNNVYSESVLENAEDGFEEVRNAAPQELEAAVQEEGERFVEFLQGFFAADDNRYYVLEAEGVPVCAARLSKIEDFYYLEALETAPEHRRKGYAARLLKHIIDTYSLRGMVDIRDCVVKSNEASLATHRKCGFTVFQENGICYLYNTVNDNQYGMRYFSEGI